MTLHFYKDVLCLFLFFAVVFLTISCGRAETGKDPVVFEVCEETELPDELRNLIEEKKKEPFAFTYENSAFLYLAVGYGEQPGGEYVAAVREIYETEQQMVADMVLISISHLENEKAGQPSVCPYIVLRLEKTEKPVFFL